MLNSVGLQGPGLEAWLDRDLPALRGVGRACRRQHLGPHVADYARAAELVAVAAAVAGPARASWRSRSTSAAPTWRTARACSPTRPTRRRGSWRPPRAACRAGPSSAPTCPTWSRSPGRGRGRGRRADAGQHAARPGPRHRVGPARARRRRRRALGARRAPGRRARRVGVPGAFPEVPIVGVGGVIDRPRRRGAARGRCRRRPGRHRDLPGPPGALEGAPPAGALVRRPRHDGGRHPDTGAPAGDRRRHGRPDADSRDATAGTPYHRSTKEDGMADSFGDRVAAAVRAHRAAVRGHRPVGRAAGRVGADRRRDGAARLLSHVRRGVRRGGGGDQATGGLLRAARLGRHGGAGAPDRRGDGRRPDRDRRRQAGRHRLDRARPTPTRGSATPARWPPTR